MIHVRSDGFCEAVCGDLAIRAPWCVCVFVCGGRVRVFLCVWLCLPAGELEGVCVRVCECVCVRICVRGV